jgi:hypothetical protein
LNLYDSTGAVVTGDKGNGAGTAVASSGGSHTYTVTSAGIYYLGSADGGINIWSIEIIYNS